MKYLLFLVLISISCCSPSPANAQGRVVINEYLPWPSNGCGVTSEFVELLNFGPGPVNIGCYILTEGDFSITIPANTILLPGQYYIIAGRDVIRSGCANTASAVNVNLNWNTCNCTSAPIPTTGDGLFTDGGTAGEQVILLDPNLKVVDALVRVLPAEPSSAITTSSIGGQCVSKTFDLDTMGIPYETIGESTGRGNTFARRLDGDCGWVKETQQSGGSTNNTSGDASDVEATLTITNATGCANSGSVSVYFSAADLSQVFPVTYNLGFDADNDNIFEFSDTYTTAIDSTNAVDIYNLRAGRYRIVLAPVNGCSYKAFDFSILPCGQLTLRNEFIQLTGDRTGKNVTLDWTAGDCTGIKNFKIERSFDGKSFGEIASVAPNSTVDLQRFSWSEQLPGASIAFYRIQVLQKNGLSWYSSIVPVQSTSALPEVISGGPNPFESNFRLTLVSETKQIISLLVTDVYGRMHWKRSYAVEKGLSQLHLDLHSLPKGLYLLRSANNLIDGNTFPLKIVKR